MALLAGYLSRVTNQKEDASIAAFYLIALAAGVMIISAYGSAVDLLHLLFGSALAVDENALIGMAMVTSIILIVLALIYRPLILECFDPVFLRTSRGPGALVHLCFLCLVVLNLVACFLTLGSMMSIGLLMLPAIAARLWVHDIGALSITAGTLSISSSVLGLILSFHLSLPTGPSIVLIAGGFYGVSLLLGTQGGWLSRKLALQSHRES